MSVICEHCGTVSEKYKVLCYQPKYLEEYLENYFGHDIMSLLNDNIKTRKQRLKRRICIYVMYKFSGLLIRQVSEKYNIRDTSVQFLADLERSQNQDVLFISRQLEDGLNKVNQKLSKQIK